MMFDKQGQAAIDKANLETGSMTVNEIRKQYDMPAVDKGDTVYVSTNLAELGSDKLRGTSQNNQSNPNVQNNQNTQNNPITQNPQNPQDKQDGLQ
jgi:hypothetical protein